jgi:hypothetical protein
LATLKSRANASCQQEDFILNRTSRLIFRLFRCRDFFQKSNTSPIVIMCLDEIKATAKI